MEEQIIEKLTINKIVPARNLHYLYARTNEQDVFIYAHRDLVELFAKSQDEDGYKFANIVSKLIAVKYFNEKSENCIGKTKLIDFEKETDTILKFGTCLVSFNLMENFKADIWINNKLKTVEFHLKDAGEFRNKTDYYNLVLPDLKEDERLAKKEAAIEKFKKSFNEQLVSLIQEQPAFFKKLFSFGYGFNEVELNEIKNDLDWDEVSVNPNINWNYEMVKSFSDNINWNLFCRYHPTFWNIENIELFTEKIDWESLSANTDMKWTIPIIEKYSNKLSWINLSCNDTIPWSADFIIKYKHKLNIESLLGNKGVFWTIELLEQLKNGIKNWDRLGTNTGKFWTIDFIEKYINKIDWDYIYEPKIPLTFSFVEKHIERIGWRFVSKNPCLPWSEEMIEKYKNELYFGWLSGNTGLPWSLELINKYADKWNWDRLINNPAIPWTEEYIENNLMMFQNSNGTWSLWENKRLPKDENFWIEHKELLFPSHKGSGLWKIIDASNNESIPLSLNLAYKLKDNLDWNGYFYRNIKQTGKYKILMDGFSIDLFRNFQNLKHFEKSVYAEMDRLRNS